MSVFLVSVEEPDPACGCGCFFCGMSQRRRGPGKKGKSCQQLGINLRRGKGLCETNFLLVVSGGCAVVACCSPVASLPSSRSGCFSPYTDMTVGEELTANSRVFLWYCFDRCEYIKKVSSSHLSSAGS